MPSAASVTPGDGTTAAMPPGLAFDNAGDVGDRQREHRATQVYGGQPQRGYRNHSGHRSPRFWRHWWCHSFLPSILLRWICRSRSSGTPAIRALGRAQCSFEAFYCETPHLKQRTFAVAARVLCFQDCKDRLARRYAVFIRTAPAFPRRGIPAPEAHPAIHPISCCSRPGPGGYSPCRSLEGTYRRGDCQDPG